MDEVETIPTRIKNFAKRHKTGIAVTATSAFWIWVNRTAIKQHNAFLTEKGLYDEFYQPED